ncbi:MAG: hypothetical protein RLZZ500_2144 [Bacteroidota bacterium]|jgi:hypothetical protein
MSHKSPIRKDKTCLNCNHVVAERFCPNCGQENTDTRKTFYHLFVHFFEDLTHYENAFWKTIRNLLFKPASLTREYLSGKRLSYLAPVRLYIFISFVTFLCLTLFTNPGELEKDESTVNITDQKANRIIQKHKKNPAKEIQWLESQAQKNETPKPIIDSLRLLVEQREEAKINREAFLNFGYNTIREMDSIREKNPEKIGDFEYWINKKSIEAKYRIPHDQLGAKFMESMIHNFPKSLFIYMPLFALVLWLFHNKKRWYYFDHGIFTLHYFSFLLLINLLVMLVEEVLDLLGNGTFITLLQMITRTVTLIWMFYYFFPAHHRFYGESRGISFLKSIGILIINVILISILLIGLIIYSFVNLH